MNRSFLLISIILLLLINTHAFGQPNQPSLDIQVLNEPERVTIDGKPAIYYELRFTNDNDNDIQLNAVHIIRSKNSRSLFLVSKEELKKRYAPIGSNNETEAMLPSGSSAIVYLEFPVSGEDHITLQHRVKYKIPILDRNKTFVLEGVEIEVRKTKPVTFGPPLEGGPWAAIHSPSWERGHRRVIYTQKGTARIPGRFAIDFIKLDDQGLQASGDENIINNWYGYGASVLAVADGVVAALRDDFKESKAISEHPEYMADNATGNYIALDIGNGKYVFYEHLKPSSIKVNVGQKVEKGDVIASLGFTGQSTGPHLHLHLADKNSPLGAEGIPFVFERFSLLGSYKDFGSFGKARWQKKGVGKIFNEHPAPNTVLYFDK